MIRIVLLSLCVLVLLTGVAGAEEYPLPPDGPAFDVTRPPFNAKGDGKTDDTEALNRALTARARGMRLVYLPNGVYLVSGPLVTAKKRTIIHGQSRERTIIRLADHCEGYADPQRPRLVLQAGHAGSNDFFNSVHNLTIDTGTGNPGAIGMRYHTSNQGAVTNVLIRSGDPQRLGAVGLDLTAPAPGPGLIKNVHIEGFDVGIECRRMPGFCMTFEHITLRNQRKVGIVTERLPFSIRGLKSTNSVPALRIAGSWGFVSLVDAELEGGSPDLAAIENVQDGGLFVRNLATKGYQVAIRSTVGRVTTTIWGPKVAEFSSHRVLSVLPGAATVSLNLPIEETPVVPWGDPKDWASVTDYLTAEQRQQRRIDVADALQKAIDSGKPTVYFPNGSYVINKTIHVRGSVGRILGIDSRIGGNPGEGNPFFRIEDGKPDVVVLERFSWGGGRSRLVEHVSARTLVLRHLTDMPGARAYRGVRGAGRLFLEDCCFRDMQLDHQQVWMRQINPEAKSGEIANIVNRGGVLWILGVKTEGPRTVVTTTDGGRTEVLGVNIYPNRGAGAQPAFLCVDSSQSLVYCMVQGWISPDALYTEQVREIRNGRRWSLWRGDVFKRGGPGTRLGGVFVPLYVGYTAEPRPAGTAAGQAKVAGPTGFYRGGLSRTGSYSGKALREIRGTKWSFRTAGPTGTPVVAGDTVYFGSRGNATGYLHAVDRAKGRERWKFAADGEPGIPGVANSMVYVGMGQTMYGLDARTGRERWRLRTDGTTVFAPAADGDTLLFTSGDGHLYAADARTGLEKWRLHTGCRVASGPAVADGIAYVGLERGLQAVDVRTGKEKWYFRTGAPVRFPMVADGIAYAACERLYALDGRTGRQRWSRKVFESPNPQVAMAGGVIYIGAPREQGIVLLDAKTGQIKDTIKLIVTKKYSRTLRVYRGPVLVGGVLYCQIMDAWQLCAIDLKRKDVLWTRGGPVHRVLHYEPVVVDGVLYLAGETGLAAIE